MALARSWLSIVAVMAVAVCRGSFLLVSEAQQPYPSSQSSRFDSVAGKRTFTSTCGGCHGLDGRGGERAPNIADSAKLQRRSDDEIAAIVSNGIPGTGMPAFHSLTASEVHSVVRYLRVLQGQRQASALPGNPARGKQVFFGKGECASCHMIEGEGGFMGPDLSAYALTRSPKEILEAIINRGNIVDSSRGAVVLTHDGRKFSGLVRNEDNFSLQIQTEDGAFHFFLKSELESLEHAKDRGMPADYGERLGRKELNDLASYLMSVGRAKRPDPTLGDED